MTQKKAKRRSSLAFYSDKVCDIANNEQLVTFIKYVDPDSSIATTQVLPINNLTSWNNKIKCVDSSCNRWGKRNDG